MSKSSYIQSIWTDNSNINYKVIKHCQVKMESVENGTSVVFDIELDNFKPNIEQQQTIEDLDRKWSDLAENNFGESSENRKKIVAEFREKIKDEKLEKSVQILIGEK